MKQKTSYKKILVIYKIQKSLNLFYIKLNNYTIHLLIELMTLTATETFIVTEYTDAHSYQKLYNASNMLEKAPKR